MTRERAVAKTYEVNVVRLSYRELGGSAGSPVVLLHGSGSESATWDRFIRRLVAAGYRCVALDLRGHAASDRTADYALTSIRDDVLHLLAELSLHDVTLIGHSVGGYAALAAAVRAPARIARLVLEDVAAPPRDRVPFTSGSVRRTVPAAVGILTHRRNYELRALLAIVRQLSRPDPDWWAQLGVVRQPTLVLSVGSTSFIPPARLAERTAALPDARFVTIPVGHRVHSLAPERFAAETKAFLSETDPSAGRVLESHTVVPGR